MHTKTCPACDKTLPVSEFGKNRQTPDGLMYYCRACAAHKQREYRQSHPDAAMESKRRYLAKLRARNDARNANNTAEPQ